MVGITTKALIGKLRYTNIPPERSWAGLLRQLKAAPGICAESALRSF